MNGIDRLVYLAVQAHQQKTGWPATVRDVCEIVGYKSTSTAHLRLQRLVRDGFVVQRGKQGYRVAA